MNSLGILLKQIKEKEEHDLAYTKKIKEVEVLIKAEQENIKKLNYKQKKLFEEIKRKNLKNSAGEITRLELLHQKQIWEDLLQEVQEDLSQSEANLDELQQSVCSSRLSFCNELKAFLNKHELFDSLKSGHNLSSSVTLPSSAMKSEQDEDEEENLSGEITLLENQLEELKTEKIKIDEAEVLKAQLEAEPTCGKEFLRYQQMLVEIKDNLKQAEKDETCLKMKIDQIFHLNNRSLKVEDMTVVAPVRRENYSSLLTKTLEVAKSTPAQEPLSALKTVTFNSTVEMKTISPPLKNKTTPTSKNKTKSPSAALRKKLAQQLTSQLDETMRDILFKDEY